MVTKISNSLDQIQEGDEIHQLIIEDIRRFFFTTDGSPWEGQNEHQSTQTNEWHPRDINVDDKSTWKLGMGKHYDEVTATMAKQRAITPYKW